MYHVKTLLYQISAPAFPVMARMLALVVGLDVETRRLVEAMVKRRLQHEPIALTLHII